MECKRTAEQAGWRESRYNICAWLQDGMGPIIANLYSGWMGACPPSEFELLKNLQELPETHPALEELARRGLAVDFDEAERLRSPHGKKHTKQRRLKLAICPTMGCNFDCPYCFQEHHAGKMSKEVQGEIAALVDRLLEASGAEELDVVWYGGEPLLAPDVIERLTVLMNDACTKHGAGFRASMFTNGYLLDEEAVRLLFRMRVKSVRVTVDGIGATHDATRHLVGGGATFERIMENLSAPLPFPVEVRMNVHKGNLDEVEHLRERIDAIAQETGNRLFVHEAEVFDNDLARSRDDAPELVSEDIVKRLSLLRTGLQLHGANSYRCSAQNPHNVCIDEQGRLFACSATLARPELSFGNARDWNPADPASTTSCPEIRDFFLTESLPENDPECAECLWLPVCVGGCPWTRLQGKRDCVPWKDDPEGFVLAQYARMGEKDIDVKLTPEAVGKIAAPILEKWGIGRAWVYGSVALGLAGPRSDVDIIVEMPPGKYLGYGIFDLRRELREALGRKLDLHTPPTAHTNKSLASVIEGTKVLVYEASPAAE